jgi:YD repeat-containing protein
VVASSHSYDYNAANQRIKATLQDGSYWEYGYDSLGQVTNAVKKWADDTLVAGQQFGYQYDDIGNRSTAKSGGDSGGSNLRISTHTAIALNQYTERTVPNTFDVLGAAHADATVAVNNEPTDRKGEYYRAELWVTNSASAVYQPVTVVGVRHNVLLLTRKFFRLNIPRAPRHARLMDKPIFLCGRIFTPELILHLNQLIEQNPALRKNALARILCQHLGWFDPRGRPATSSAKVALRKLQRRGLLREPHRTRRPPSKRSHRLRRSGQQLPRLSRRPRELARIQGLRLVLLTGHEDPLHGLWNDLMIAQHPCGDAPLVGAQLRYLIGSDHGWLGALGVGPAAFVLGARDLWIGWSPAARTGHLNRVVGLARFLIRQEVRCRNLASKVLSLALARLPDDWQVRYGSKPVLVETFVDRARFTGRCFAAANWRRIGASTGRGRLGPKTPRTTPKDIWVYPLTERARSELQQEAPPPLRPCPLLDSLAQEQWWQHELDGLDLGDRRLHRRAQMILQARWAQPQASFYGSFESWTPAKGAYAFIEHEHAPLSLETLLAAHAEATQARMAAESVVLLVQDTTTLNYSGLHQIRGLGPLGDAKGRGLWLHSLLAFRPDTVPLGVARADCWARPEEAGPEPGRGRNARSIDEKESARWLETFHAAARMARRMPQTELVVINDREGDLYELHEAVQVGPPNLHTLIRARHDRNLESHQKLWALLAEAPLGGTRRVPVPRRRGQSARQATLELRWSAVTIQAPQVGCKKGWPPLTLWAVWVREGNPPPGVEPIEWMLLSDRPVANREQAWETVQWYRSRWGIEEWHRALKSGCGVEQREFKTAEHLQRVLAFDLMVAWRVLASLKRGRALPQLPASVLYSEDELGVLWAVVKKRPSRKGGEWTLAEANRMVARLGGWLGRASDGEPGAESVGVGMRRLRDLARGWRLRQQMYELSSKGSPKCV